MIFNKKTLRELLLYILTVGAGLLIGFLSFTGMLAITPVLSLAFLSFGLSIAYEGQIFYQNIDGALKKLFKPRYFEQQLAKKFLLENFPQKGWTKGWQINLKPRPAFFDDYEKLLKYLDQLPNAPEFKKQRLNAEKDLRSMEKWFAKQLFQSTSIDNENKYVQALQEWFEERKSTTESFQEQLKNHQIYYGHARILSLISGLFMTLGTTYLLMESFMAIPALAAYTALFPVFIVPLSIIAGIAYSLQIYNALTDMISQKTLQKRYEKIMNEVKQDHWLMPCIAVVLVLFALALTLCTAGTWWTIAKQTPPLFRWMKQWPQWIMGVIHPLVTGLTSLAFILENTDESLNTIENLLSSKIKMDFSGYQKESWRTLLNPFRWFIAGTFIPLKGLMFLGHLISIGVTTGRLPGLSATSSALIGFTSEGGEDLHYFFPTAHPDHGHTLPELLKQRLDVQHQHEHHNDWPTQILTYIFYPLFGLAARWDHYVAGEDLNTAWNNYSQTTPINACAHQTNAGFETPPQISPQWKKQHAMHLVERFTEKYVHDEALKTKLDDYKENIRQGKIGEKQTISRSSQSSWFFKTQEECTQDFLDVLDAKIMRL